VTRVLLPGIIANITGHREFLQCHIDHYKSLYAELYLFEQRISEMTLKLGYKPVNLNVAGESVSRSLPARALAAHCRRER